MKRRQAKKILRRGDIFVRQDGERIRGLGAARAILAKGRLFGHWHPSNGETMKYVNEKIDAYMQRLGLRRGERP